MAIHLIDLSVWIMNESSLTKPEADAALSSSEGENTSEVLKRPLDLSGVQSPANI